MFRTGIARALAALALSSLLLASCGDGGGGGGVQPPPEGECPEATSLEVTTSELGTFTLEVTTAYALRIEDDSLFGDYWSAAWADFEAEPDTNIGTEGDQRAVALEIYTRDQTMPETGTFDFEGQQNTFFQPAFHTDGTSQPVTTLGEGGTLTVTVASEDELCGSLDVSDGSLTIRGTFRAPVETRE